MLNVHVWNDNLVSNYGSSDLINNDDSISSDNILKWEAETGTSVSSSFCVVDEKQLSDILNAVHNETNISLSYKILGEV